MATFASVLRELRQFYGITYEQIAAECLCTTALVWKWEHGKCVPALQSGNMIRLGRLVSREAHQRLKECARRERIKVTFTGLGRDEWELAALEAFRQAWNSRLNEETATRLLEALESE